MFISPNHPNRAALLARQKTPEPSGRVLAKIPRKGFAGRPDGEVVLTLERLDASEFLSLRLWVRAPNGMFPSKTRATIRLCEAEEIARAILEGLRLADNPPARPAAGNPARGRRAGGSPRREAPLFEPSRTSPDPAFDEFATT